ncbi:MAG TPA: hypothetical protein VFJ16_09605 [Longimicrobium sp.]|nr:hypothetical protein [Longimicrobium sp.]
MRKIRLELETLSVESFVPADAAADARGTVNAHALGTRGCTGMTLCETNCDCSFNCPSVGPCTTQ